MRAPRKGDSTPWGAVQMLETYGDGESVVFVSTASHGGFWLSPERLADMPAGLKDHQTFCGSPCWFEEDCDALIVTLAFPDLFSDYMRFCAFGAFKGYVKPEIAAAYLATEHGRAAERFHAEYLAQNRTRFRVGACSSCGKGWRYFARSLDGKAAIEFEHAEYRPVADPFTLEELTARGIQWKIHWQTPLQPPPPARTVAPGMVHCNYALSDDPDTFSDADPGL